MTKKRKRVEKESNFLEDYLPTELLMRIFNYLSDQTAIAFLKVCKRFNELKATTEFLEIQQRSLLKKLGFESTNQALLANKNTFEKIKMFFEENWSVKDNDNHQSRNVFEDKLSNAITKLFRWVEVDALPKEIPEAHRMRPTDLFEYLYSKTQVESRKKIFESIPPLAYFYIISNLSPGEENLLHPQWLALLEILFFKMAADIKLMLLAAHQIAKISNLENKRFDPLKILYKKELDEIFNKGFLMPENHTIKDKEAYHRSIPQDAYKLPSKTLKSFLQAAIFFKKESSVRNDLMTLNKFEKIGEIGLCWQDVECLKSWKISTSHVENKVEISVWELLTTNIKLSDYILGANPNIESLSPIRNNRFYLLPADEPKETRFENEIGYFSEILMSIKKSPPDMGVDDSQSLVFERKFSY